MHALVGENGAGKSTLVKILTGVVEPDAGEILIDGQPRWIGDPQTAYKLGIVAMYQEPTVFPDLTVAENVFAGRHPRSALRTVDWRAMQAEAMRILDELGVDFGPDTPVRGLGVADRQLLEIAKALSTSARLLIMDEPTAALSPHEVENLFATVRRLRERGVAVVFISHRLEEVGALADTVTVLRDGRHIATRPARELSQDEIIRLMVGRSLDALFPKEEAEIGDVVLKAAGLTRRGVFSDVSFELRRGEIVGLAGFVGAGRTEVARSIFGIDPLDGGSSRSRAVRSGRARRARRSAAVSPISPRTGCTRASSSRCPSATTSSMAVLPELTAGRVPPAADASERSHAGSWSSCGSRRPRRRRSCGASRAATSRRSCSAKWLAAEPRILILDEPTHGVDVGTKADVHRTISHLAARGADDPAHLLGAPGDPRA